MQTDLLYRVQYGSSFSLVWQVLYLCSFISDCYKVILVLTEQLTRILNILLLPIIALRLTKQTIIEHRFVVILMRGHNNSSNSVPTQLNHDVIKTFINLRNDKKLFKERQ